MAERRPDPKQEPASDDAGGGLWRRLRLVLALTLVGVLVTVTAVLATGLMTGQGSPSVGASPPSGTPSAAAGVASSPLGASARPLIAAVDEQGALATMDELGGTVVSYAVPGVVLGFPAWSPDGSRIAAVGYGPDDTSIYVFTVQRGGGGNTDPVVIYRSPDRPPFYLYWAPDSRMLAFLATEPAGISLRIAPADGSAPLDGSSPGSVIRRGAPLYFAWEGADRLLLHVGSGSGAFVGEVGLDGTAVAPTIPGSGNFRSASVSRDGLFLAYVRSVTDSSGEIVVASRDGASRRNLAVFGPAAFVFDPTGDTMASIAADKPVKDALAFPLGPLRLIDARSGSIRTLLDGSVIAFFWAPDGRTIAALRVAQPTQKTADTGFVLSGATAARPVAAATSPPGAEVRIAFVDVSTGVVRSEHVVRLASTFVNELLPYFDQYALSHRLWSPDSASILLPLVDATGRARLVLVPTDGVDSPPIAGGVSGFWSP